MEEKIRAGRAYTFTERDPTRPPNPTAGHSRQTCIRENQIAATTAAAEINGIWQENLLFFQCRVLPSKHKDRVENGCCRGAGLVRGGGSQHREPRTLGSLQFPDAGDFLF